MDTKMLCFLRGRHPNQQSSLARILEINPNHLLIQNLSNTVGQEDKEEILKEMAWLLYDQALILEGQPVTEHLFTKRLATLMNSQLKAA